MENERPGQLDTLSSDERRAIIRNVITRITAHFDKASYRHSVSVEFSEAVSRLLASNSDPGGSSSEHGVGVGGPFDPLSDPVADGQQETAAKKSRGSRDFSAAEIKQSVTVE